MNVLRRIWAGIVSAVAGVALAILVQVIGQMTMGWQIDCLKWTVLAFASIGFLLGFVIGPRNTKARSKGGAMQN
jgi:hypothetical protein